MANKQYLIVIDEEKSTRTAALAIITRLFGNSVKVVGASTFDGTDILGSEIIFIGCNKPSPESFSYFEEVLKHINLSTRKCALFSTSPKNGVQAIRYLENLIRDSEVKLCCKSIITRNIARLQMWVSNILKGEIEKNAE
ncbi:MAG: hypothetical protein Ta2G_17020 [Termitinemataceae bacterium]|nr:MAG: hypothetical protein Ta2G_17020 [Termitinemataceae bacterium]